MFIQELRNDNNISQTLIWTAVDYPDEVHDDVENESLKGRPINRTKLHLEKCSR